MKKVSEKVFHDNWWIEYVEGEFDPSTAKDLALFLKNSPADHAVVESLEWTKSKLRQMDDVALPEDGHYYDQLHAKIMAAVVGEESSEVEPVIAMSDDMINVVTHPFGHRSARTR